MGISTYQSYCGAQIFEAVGLQKRVRRQVLHRHREQRRGHRPVRGRRGGAAAAPARRSATIRCSRNALDAGGEYHYRIRGEEHMWTPDSIAKLQHAARAGSYATYKEYARADQRPDAADADAARPVRVPVRAGAGAAREVEPAAEIVKRFATGAMSLGSISTEAHTTLAVAMNRIGGKSNTGEGGEDAQRYPLVEGRRDAEVADRRRVVGDIPLKEGDSLRSKIKQVASGRFGVTAEYLRQRRPDPDQDGAGREARRRRPAARPQGLRVHREAALLGAGRGPHLAAAAPRHLLDRGPGAADPRPQERESAARRSR